MTNDIERLKDITYLSFDDAFSKVREETHNKLSATPRVIREYTRHLTASRGKYIRAISLLNCAIRNDGLIHPDAICFAASIELLHLATLVHDDVIDDAEIRRGVSTLQNKYGKRTAVICGDYLLSLALQTAAKVKHPEEYLKLNLENYINRICLGELSQHINNNNLELTLFRYLKIISGKTAALFEACFFAGAILCQKDSAIINKYRRLGHYLGMIFQLIDDCNDYEVTESIAKKPVESDYEQGVVTMPLIYTIENNKEFKEKLSSGNLSRNELNNAISDNGGLRFTHLFAKRYYNKFINLLNSLNLSGEKHSRMMDLVDWAYVGSMSK